MNRTIAVLLLLSVSVSVFAQTDTSAKQADFVTDVFLKTCAAHLGQNRTVSEWVQKNRYVRANEQFSKAALRGQSGEVWGVPNNIGQFLVVLTGENHCAAWARTANAAVVNQHFERIVKGLARPGIAVSTHIDKISDGVGGSYRQLGFHVRRDGAPHDWILLATTSESKQAEVQVRLTISPVSPNPSLQGTLRDKAAQRP